MRFLIDNALSPDLVDMLQQAGHDALHVRTLGFATAADAVIFDYAAQNDRVVVSADTDFGTLLALRRECKPSVILFRGASPRRPGDQAALLVANLAAIENDLIQGAIVIIEPRRIRVRRLPIAQTP